MKFFEYLIIVLFRMIIVLCLFLMLSLFFLFMPVGCLYYIFIHPLIKEKNEDPVIEPNDSSDASIEIEN